MVVAAVAMAAGATSSQLAKATDNERASGYFSPGAFALARSYAEAAGVIAASVASDSSRRVHVFSGLTLFGI